MPRFLRSSAFWLPFILSVLVIGGFFAWELGVFSHYVRSLPRVPASPVDLGFTVLLTFLLSLTISLSFWTSRVGSCPRGVHGAAGAAGVLGIVSLLCPICLALPASLLGIGAAFAVLAPFLPLLRLIALILLGTAVYLLWPKK